MVADTNDGGLSIEEWIALIVLGILVVGAIIAVTAWISGRSERSGQRAAERDRQSNKVIGGARWAHDQAAMTVLATTDAAALQSTWPAIQAQLFDWRLRSRRRRSETRPLTPRSPSWAAVFGDLRGALAADVALRLSSQGQQYELVEASRRNVLQRSDQLEQAIRALVAAQSSSARSSIVCDSYGGAARRRSTVVRAQSLEASDDDEPGVCLQWMQELLDPPA